MANNTIGCRSGKTILVDPNSFDGQSSVSNISVPLEDLNISVELRTSKKARTVLTTQNDGSEIVNVGESSNDLVVNFIEGTNINGHKVLTSKFTDLTTTFDRGSDGENLGITNIDIDFSSSYAPMITINFIDVRGSAIFQNEDKIIEAQNKYATFFQLPYPIYQLTIKGYYGQPVKYCLHMTKFNSRFNSQTGNFEITANFIGYTYAILSDMLLGYLKAIPYTKLGAAKYDKLRQEQPNLLTLNQLMDKISKINVTAQRIKSNDPDAAQLSNGDQKKSELSSIETNLLILGQDMDIKNDLNRYDFIIFENVKPVNSQYFPSQILNGPTQQTQTNNNSRDIDNKISKYTTDVTNNIEIYNQNNELKLVTSDFTRITSKQYSGLTLKMLNPQGDPLTATDRESELRLILGNQKDFNQTRLDIYNYIIKTYALGADQTFDVLDLRNLYSIISNTRNSIDAQTKKLQKSLATTLKTAIRQTIGFDPTIRNIVNVFTTSVEVLLSVIYDVSASAINPNNSNRTTQLKKFSGESYDIKDESNGTTPANSPSGPLSLLYYPWPDYRKDDEIEGLVETYLGEPGILSVPSDVNELEFIDELLTAFITSQADTEQSAITLAEETSNWFPVNPLDTRLYTTTFPYRRIAGNTRSEVLNLLLIRAMTYMGYSNEELSPDEIQTMANAEADSILSDIANEKIIQSLTQISSNDIKNTTGIINSKETRVIKELNSEFYYDYIFDSNGSSASSADQFKIIPISSGFTGLWSPKLSDLVSDSNNGNLFLTNYTTTSVLDNGNSTFANILAGLGLNPPAKWIPKPNDGGIYVKIIPQETYYGQTVNPLVNTLANNGVLDLSLLKLKDNKFPKNGVGVGFDPFGGTYGYQEFTKLNYGNDDLTELQFMYMFYQDSNFGSKIYNKSNGIGLKRNVSGEEGKATTSPYDIVNTSFGVANTINDIIQYIDGDKALHSNYGKNRVLINNYTNKGSQDVTYPFINFNVFYKNVIDGYSLAPVSLFGSRLYYEQTSDYSRALLFLHSQPWNGLITTEDDDALFTTTVNNTIFDKGEILNTFGRRAGFVSVPKLWAAFIGGLLWRADYSEPIYQEHTTKQISGGSGINDPILFKNSLESFIPTFDVNTPVPSKLQYLTKRQSTTEKGKDYPNSQMTFSNVSVNIFDGGGEYKRLDPILLGLPNQVKEEFKQIFFEFVTSNDLDSPSDWIKIKNQLEIFDGVGSQWVTAYNSIISSVSTNVDTGQKTLSVSTMRNTYNVVNGSKINFDNYSIFTPILNDQTFKNNYILELKDNTQAVKTILDIFTSEIIVANMSYKIWNSNDSTNVNARNGIYVKTSDLNIYLDSVIAKFTQNKDAVSPDTKKKNREQAIFGTNDENIIKLQLYRTCKNIYDKWVGGATDTNNVMFQCGGRNDVDTELAKKARGNSATPTLIDSFRFVTRSFRDIGDELIINPTPVNDFLLNNPNSNFYDAITSLLSANNFDFIALPSYINYNDEDTLQSMFKPMQYSEALSNGISGPSFVCVYVGQKSKHLDFKGSEYSNDGFDVHCDDNGNVKPNLPKDFTSTKEDFENNVAVFAVNYSQQNQNIFKDIVLDQSEFSETAESLQIIDEIAKKGSENNRTLAGQNLYNVYSVRSYKTEVEMMGNAMIQPMMYYQLNNIPMFHGAYMITHVKHSIKPNFMSTHFTGVRIRKPETPLIDVGVLYMSLLDSIEASNIVTPAPNFGTTTGRLLGVGYSSSKYGIEGSNNPGNLRPGNGCSIPKGIIGFKGCADTQSVGSFIEFEDILYGMQAALQNKKQSIGGSISIADGYKGPRKTLLTYLMRYSPPSENDTNSYVNKVGQKLQTIIPTFTWNTLLSLNPNFTTILDPKTRRTIGWENFQGSGRSPISKNWIDLVAITKAGSSLLEPGFLPNGGGSDLTQYKAQYEASRGQDDASYQLFKNLTAIQWELESGAGTLINLIDKNQFWMLWQNQYKGDKAVFGNWGGYAGNFYVDNMFKDTKYFGNSKKAGTWKAEIPKQFWY